MSKARRNIHQPIGEEAVSMDMGDPKEDIIELYRIKGISDERMQIEETAVIFASGNINYKNRRKKWQVT